MANVISTITKYMTKAVDTVFATESKTAVLENGSKYIDFSFESAGQVKILDILMDGLSDYYRGNTQTGPNAGYSNYNASGNHGDGYRIGNTQAKWRTYDLTQDRGKQFQVDEMDNEETAGMVIANLLTEFLRTKVVPEVDAYRFAKIASKSYESLGNRVNETPVTTKGNASEITHLWNKAFEWLTEHEVPEEEQVIFVSPSTWTVCANTEEIYKTFTDKTVTTERGVDFTFKAYMGRPIIQVPSDRFYTGIAVHGDNGYSPEEGAKVINYIVASKRAIVPIVKLQKSKIFGPDVNQDFDGYKVNFRLYHDVIIPANKIVGAYVSVSNVDASSKASLLNVAIEKSGIVATPYTLVAHYTVPAGMLGRVVHADTAFNVGDTYNGDAYLDDGDFFKETTDTNKKEFFALVDSNKKVIAASAETALPA